MSFSAISFVITITCVCIIKVTNSQSCTLDVRNLPSHPPVFITNKKLLAKNVDKLMSWKIGEKVQIYCSGQQNALKQYGGTHAVIQCKNTGFYVNGKEGLGDIACLADNQGDLMITNNACISGGVFKYIGFKAKDTTFLKYISICYNNKKASPVYTYHTIWGKGSRYTAYYEPPLFSLSGMPNVNAITAYYDQEKSLENIIGNKLKFYKRKDRLPIFTKGHLTPRADGTFRSWQTATYYFINTVPQFGDVNHYNWETLETLVRGKASISNAELEVYTGVSGTLELLDQNNKRAKILLKDRKGKGVIPVPKWLWKIAKLGNRGIGFVTLNNPHVLTVTPVCKNICKEYGWHHSDFPDVAKGVTICCTVESLMKAFPEVPPGAAVSDVLPFGI